MKTNATRENSEGGRWRAWRALPWIVSAILLVLPAVAMRLGAPGVDWTASDFVAMGAMLLVACGSFELLARLAPDVAYLAGAAIGVGTGFLLAWANLAVGIVGEGAHAANLMFFAVLLVPVFGGAWARLRPMALAWAMFAAAGAVVAAILVALIAFGATPREAMSTLVFAAGWAVSAALFRVSALRGAAA